MVEDESGFVVVLIGELRPSLGPQPRQEEEEANGSEGTDEVESLTAARAGAMSGKEPSDALRVCLLSSPSFFARAGCSLTPCLFARLAHAQVVNALLTQLDKLKHRKNVLVMTTSNLSAAIGASPAFFLALPAPSTRSAANEQSCATTDGAFIDRADIKQYIGLCVPCSLSYRAPRRKLMKSTDRPIEQPTPSSSLLDPPILPQRDHARRVDLSCRSSPLLPLHHPVETRADQAATPSRTSSIGNKSLSSAIRAWS